MVKVIGIGEYGVSNGIEDSIKTFALASCVGLVVYSPKEKVLGMVHIVLPNTKEHREGGCHYGEGYFADTATPFIFGKVFGGYPSERIPYQVTLYGGASSRNKNDVFNVGKRNIEKIEEILSEKKIRYNKENTGGYISRTIEAFVRDGHVTINSQEMFNFTERKRKENHK